MLWPIQISIYIDAYIYICIYMCITSFYLSLHLKQMLNFPMCWRIWMQEKQKSLYALSKKHFCDSLFFPGWNPKSTKNNNIHTWTSLVSPVPRLFWFLCVAPLYLYLTMSALCIYLVSSCLGFSILLNIRFPKRIQWK